MISMRRVGKDHQLVLNIENDTAYVVARTDFDYSNPLLTIDRNLICRDAQGSIVNRITLNNESEWISKNSLGIETTPVYINRSESVFIVEAEFAEKWLALQVAA